VTHHGAVNIPPSAQVEAASGMAAMDRALHGTDTTRAALAEMLAALLLNVSAGNATPVGGVIDMAHLGRSLVSYGRPDAAFALLSANGSNTLYHMAKSTGTLWAHPGGADGGDGKCTSHNHIMMGGSVGEALYGIGGIQPSFIREAVPDAGDFTEQLLLAPVPWLPDAPRGAAVWRTDAGMASTSWAAVADSGSSETSWRVWVNVTIPVHCEESLVKIMVPKSAQPNAVCVWECGFQQQPSPTFETRWTAFDDGGGFYKTSAAVPPSAPSPDTTSSVCTALWRSGSSTGKTVPGISTMYWTPAKQGAAMFPALTVSAGSGTYAFHAARCAP
jgi:hypothetical protein